MQIEITGITEAEVVTASEKLDANGFKYDVDYTTLYGAEWAIVGLRFMNPAAAEAVVTSYASIHRQVALALKADVDSCSMEELEAADARLSYVEAQKLRTQSQPTGS